MVIYCLFIICHTHYIHVKWLQCSVHIFQKGSDIISSAYNSAWNKVDMNKYWLKNNINQINVLMLKQRNRNTQKVQMAQREQEGREKIVLEPPQHLTGFALRMTQTQL